MSLNRIYRLAEILQNKHTLLKRAGKPPLPTELIPTPPAILKKVKDDLIFKLYDNYFNDKNRHREGHGAGSKTILMDALFQLRDLRVPTIVNLFNKVEKLIATIDGLDAVELFKQVNAILRLIEDAVKNGTVEKELKSGDYVTLDYDQRRWRDQMYLGFKGRITDIADHLKKAKNTLGRFVPEKMVEKSVKDISVPGSDVLDHWLIQKFLASPAAHEHNLFRANWEMMYNDPTLRSRIANMVRSWNRNNDYRDLVLAGDILKVLEKLQENAETNVSEIEQGSGALPTSTPNKGSLFDPLSGPNVDRPFTTQRSVSKEQQEELLRKKREQEAQERGEGSGEGSF